MVSVAALTTPGGTARQRKLRCLILQKPLSLDFPGSFAAERTRLYGHTPERLRVLACGAARSTSLSAWLSSVPGEIQEQGGQKHNRQQRVSHVRTACNLRATFYRAAVGRTADQLKTLVKSAGRIKRRSAAPCAPRSGPQAARSAPGARWAWRRESPGLRRNRSRTRNSSGQQFPRPRRRPSD